jgi:hypothetical protein
MWYSLVMQEGAIITGEEVARDMAIARRRRTRCAQEECVAIHWRYRTNFDHIARYAGELQEVSSEALAKAWTCSQIACTHWVNLCSRTQSRFAVPLC